MNMPPTFASLGRRLVEAFAPVTRRWRMLDARTQAIVGTGAVLLIVACLYAYVWLPAARERDRLMLRLPQLAAQLALMQTQADEIRALAARRRLHPHRRWEPTPPRCNRCSAKAHRRASMRAADFAL